MRYLPSPAAARQMTTAELREHFLIDLFDPGLTLHFFDADRTVVGSVVPTGGGSVVLEARESASEGAEGAHFLDRREVGVLNIGAAGTVTVDGEAYDLGEREGLYVGRGARDVGFSGDGARFYLISYPAHEAYPTTKLGGDAVEVLDLGDAAQSNERELTKLVFPGGTASAQLTMGVTRMRPGSVWNTMPPHTHQRRSEVYLYFGLADGGAVMHFMGEPDETRHLVVRDGQAVISPPWSVHSGVGVGTYTFCWAMGGENQDFSDMQGVALSDLL